MDLLQIPNQLIPDSEKDFTHCKRTLLAIKGLATHDSNAKRKDIQSWYMYHNIWSEKEFEYLTRIPSGTDGQTDYYLPAKVRHIPIQRAKLNVLISQQKYRPFNFSVYICDKQGVNEKYIRKIHEYIRGAMDMIDQNVSAYYMQIAAIEQQKAEMEQFLNQEPQTEEQAQQIEMLRSSKVMIDSQLNMARKRIERELITAEEDQEKFERYYKYEYKDFVEDIAQKTARLLRDELDIDRKSLTNFKSQVVIGKQAYYVDYIPGRKQIEFDPLNMLEVYYPAVEGVEWIQDLPWVMIRRYVSLNYAVDKYKLTESEAETLKATIFHNVPITDFMNNDFGNSLSGAIYAGTMGTTEGIPEYRIFWKSPKMIQAKQTPNPYQKDKYFTHFMDDKQKQINEGQLYYDQKRQRYIHKETKEEFEKNQVINKLKGEKLEQRFIDEVWEGVILGNDMVKNVGKKPVRIYTNDNYSDTILPVIGRAYNSIIDRPYSLVWDTRDLQNTYNVLNYHRELMLAVSGVRGTIMDITQKPDGMSKEEWMYFKKLGTMWIETVKKSGRQSTFNQFGNYDDSVSPAIQYIDNMMANTDEMLGNVIGVGRQRQGQVIASDQVATFQQSIQQNSLITEIIYADHDETEKRALEAAYNLASKYIYKDGGVYDYKTDDLSLATLKIPANLLDKYDFRFIVKNNNLEERKLNEVKGFVLQEYSKGTIQFKDMLTLYNGETIKDLEKKFEQYAEEALKIAQQSNQNSAEAEAQAKERVIQLQGQIDQTIQQNELRLKQMELQMKQQLESTKLALMQKQIEVTQNQGAMDAQVKLHDIETEREIETKYINETQRSNVTDERLRAIELQMKALLENSKGLNVTKPKSQQGKGAKAMERIKD